jgi:hypothetical protein
VCVGIYPEHKPDMLAEDVALVPSGAGKAGAAERASAQ